MASSKRNPYAAIQPKSFTVKLSASDIRWLCETIGDDWLDAPIQQIRSITFLFDRKTLKLLDYKTNAPEALIAQAKRDGSWVGLVDFAKKAGVMHLTKGRDMPRMKHG